MSWADIENTEKKERIPYTKFVEGQTMIRILDEEPYSFWQHWLPAQNTSVVCLGKDCPICNQIAAAKANKMQPKYNNSRRHAMRIWNYTTNQMEIMIQGRGFMSQLLMLNREVGDLRTYDVKIIRKGTGKDTTYMAMPTAPTDFDAEGKEIEEVNMEEIFKAPTREEMLMLMQGMTWADINGTDEDESVA